MAKVNSWAELSEGDRRAFNSFADWMNHFDKDVIEEAQEYYAVRLEPNEYGRLYAVSAAWHYAQGAARFMKQPKDNG